MQYKNLFKSNRISLLSFKLLSWYLELKKKSIEIQFQKDSFKKTKFLIKKSCSQKKFFNKTFFQLLFRKHVFSMYLILSYRTILKASCVFLAISQKALVKMKFKDDFKIFHFSDHPSVNLIYWIFHFEYSVQTYSISSKKFRTKKCNLGCHRSRIIV